MNRTSPTPRAQARRLSVLSALLPPVAAIAALVAFLAGMSSGELSVAPAGRRTEDAPAHGSAPRAFERRARAPLVDRAPAPGRAAAAPEQAPPSGAATTGPLLTREGRPTPALVARVSADARRALEAARAGFTEHCVPPGRDTPATLTFNVTFDASGREIARGISEDRRQRATEVASCLRKLPIGGLKVSAPGANVGVRVAMSLP